MKISTEYIWEKGKRDSNEDSLVILHLILNRKPFLFAAVADGIGGLAEGENASSFLAYHLKSKIEETVYNRKKININMMKKILARELNRAHFIIRDYGAKKNIIMGTTIVLICAYGKKAVVFSVGDSEICRNGKRLNPIQRDEKGRLIACVGAGICQKPFSKHIVLHKNHELILSSDGYKGQGRDNKTAVIIKTK